MLSARLKSMHTGFSLVELMITVAVLAILLGVAIPSFQTMVINTQIRNATESITNGLQRARAEAVARNTNIEFVLGTNSAWAINVISPASVIESRLSTEGSTNVTRTVAPAGATTLTYNNFGQVVTPNPANGSAPGSAPLTQVDLTAVGGSKDLRVMVGSSVRMCDPSLSVIANPRGC